MLVHGFRLDTASVALSGTQRQFEYGMLASNGAGTHAESNSRDRGCISTLAASEQGPNALGQLGIALARPLDESVPFVLRELPGRKEDGLRALLEIVYGCRPAGKSGGYRRLEACGRSYRPRTVLMSSIRVCARDGADSAPRAKSAGALENRMGRGGMFV